MYFPYFRGRQYELLALRELVQNRLLGKFVMPVVEPVRITPTLNTTMTAYVEKVFQDIAAEIAKPLRRSDSPLEYLPTQYIAEFIKSKKYDGVEFASTIRQGGYNLAVFDESLFECVDVETVEVSEVLYTTDPLLSS